MVYKSGLLKYNDYTLQNGQMITVTPVLKKKRNNYE